MLLSVVNESKILKDVELQIILDTCKTQMFRDVCPAWDRLPPDILLYKSETEIPNESYLIKILDDLTQHVAVLGDHDITPNGRPYARVFIKDCLDNGGSLFQGSRCVSKTLGHEIIELFCDPYVNFWVNGPGGEFALEPVDPVENDFYSIGPPQVTVPNFVLPSWFNPYAIGKVDFLGRSPGAFKVAKGGYIVCKEQGNPKIVFADAPIVFSPYKISSRLSKRLSIYK